jgi:methionyl-tRNA formyltransferase
MPATLPTIVPRTSAAPRIVLLATPRSRKCVRIVESMAKLGVKPAAIVVEQVPDAPIASRLRRLLREEGLSYLTRKFGGSAPSAAPTSMAPDGPSDVAALAREHGIELVATGKLDSPAALEAVRATRPDVLVCAGAGILRKPLLELARLGTINAHMGLLPFYRGMNVAEWAALCHDAIGVTVHCVDTGVDTGDILLTARVDGATAKSIAEMRERCDAAQVAHLATVLHYVQETGSLPPRTPQRPEEGRQFFAMHPDLRAALVAAL